MQFIWNQTADQMTEYIELISPLCLYFLDNFYRCKNFIKYDIALREKKVVTGVMRWPRGESAYHQH